MNTKKKNKKPNKPNPNPIQKVESSTEKVEEVIKENPEVLKSEERVPEIISEVPPVIEPATTEPETPKKPKRNRGKKKKSDKDDNIEDETNEPIIEDIKPASEIKDDKKVEAQKVLQKEPEKQPTEEASNLAPTARKKKNKNKKTPEQLAEEQRIAEEELNILPITEDDVNMSDVKIVTLVPVLSESEHESKSAKKKNKKKKRNDSEKSDKADEALLCTSAFQKLLEPREEKKETEEASKEECKQPPKDNINLESTVKRSEAKPEERLEEKIGKEEAVSLKLDEKGQETQNDDGSKGKKKNKKDKKHPSKPDMTETLEEHQKTKEKIEPSMEEIPYVLKPDNQSLTEIVIEQTAETQNEKPSIEKEKSPKPKAKIAKPVEKKRKEKADIQTVETGVEPIENVTPSIPTDAKIESKETTKLIGDKKTMLSDELSPKEKETKETKSIENIEIATLVESSEKAPQLITSLMVYKTDTIQVPDNVMEKKRNKSPKPPKRKSRTPEPGSIKPVENIQVTADKSFAIPLPFEPLPHKNTELHFDAKSELDEIKIKQETVKQEKDIEVTSEKISESIPFGVPMKDKPVEVITEEKIEVEPIRSEPIVEAPQIEHMQVPETGKKRKKSPKMPKKFVATPESDKTFDKDMSPPKSDETKIKQDSKEKTETPPDLPPLEDIEIRSVQAEESEGSECDIVPDVHYPRASSQNQDDNNNMEIREIIGSETKKFNIPIVIPNTPFIQDSGETPTPEIIQTGIRVTEIEQTISKPDETMDLKSKVLEVNQDMEELRLSIERSLAELTSMEKGERETERQIEKAHSKIEQITEIASKSDPFKDMGKRALTPIKQEVEEPKIEHHQTDLKCVNPSTIEEPKLTETTTVPETPVAPVCPARKDNKGKGKSKKKGKQEIDQSSTTSSTTASEATTTASKDTSQETKKEEKSEQKTDTQEKGKQQSRTTESDTNTTQDSTSTDVELKEFVPIENFEDAMTSSNDDVNKSFEIIANADQIIDSQQNNPEITLTTAIEDDEKDDKPDKKEKINPVSPPKNLRGHPDIPVRLNKTDYKKEKNKPPNTRQAKVKIKDDVPIEINKESKESQTENRRFLKDRKSMNITETIRSMTNDNEEYIYKYSFRKVYLPNACHVCKKYLKQARVPCNFCNLVFYCSHKHKDEDYGQHQALCFAVSTIVHLKDQKHIYADAKDIAGHNYRLLRMQMIVSCEKVLKRKLVPWEQEALLYPRMCGDVSCREWRQGKLVDCDGCGQIAYCADKPDHLPKSHQRWCKSYCLYQRLVCYQQTKGRLEPKLPTKVMTEPYQIPEKMNEVLASMYEEKIDMTDIEYAALTQIATAPLTAAYCYQLYTNKMNSTYANGVHKKSSFTIHVVGAELQFEADALNKWEIFFLHIRPDVKELRVVFIGPDLNPSNLPLDLLGKIKPCENCRENKRRVVFDFQDKKTYSEYWATDFAIPDLVCTFNPSIQRSSIYNGKDTWPSTIKCIVKQKVPFVITSSTVCELQRDVDRVRECSSDLNTISEGKLDTTSGGILNIISEGKLNTLASVRPDRNFISDDEMPLLFYNYCFSVVCGGF